MIMQRLIWGALILCFFGPSLMAQKYSNEFLSIGLGARAQAMGGAMVAHVNDASSSFWNPAGLQGIETDLQVGLLHAEWFGGIGKYDYAGFGMPIKGQNKYLGFSFIRFGIDGIPNTLSLYEDDGSINYNNVTEFSAADYAFIFNYAQKFGKLAVGASPKVVRRVVGPFASSWGFGVDLGAQYQYSENWSFGAQLKDITTTFNAWQFSFTEEEKQTLGLTGNEIPIQSFEITKPQIILGAAYKKTFTLPTPEGKKARTIGLLAELDMVATTDGQRNTLISASPFSIDPALGLELNYNRIAYLRMGLNNFQRFENFSGEKELTLQPNFGLGFRISRFYIDYALANLSASAGGLRSHIVSIRLDIDYDYIKQAIQKEI